MALNLVQHRGEPSVWDRTDDRMEWDAERWLVAVMAGAFLVSGFRRRSFAGLMLVLGGGGLAWWAAAGADQRRMRRGRLRAAWPARMKRPIPWAKPHRSRSRRAMHPRGRPPRATPVRPHPAAHAH